MTSLLEQLPKIVADGKREAERIMERLESNYRVGLQTRELVIPSRDTDPPPIKESMLDRYFAIHNVNFMGGILNGEEASFGGADYREAASG